jgi:hypothetical protein
MVGQFRKLDSATQLEIVFGSLYAEVGPCAVFNIIILEKVGLRQVDVVILIADSVVIVSLFIGCTVTIGISNTTIPGS